MNISRARFATTRLFLAASSTRQPDDDRREFNRAEQLRAVPPGTDVYDTMIGWRQDSESLHNTAQRAFYGDRLPAYTLDRQVLVMLGLALRENAISHYRHKGWHKTGVPPQPFEHPPSSDGDSPGDPKALAA